MLTTRQPVYLVARERSAAIWVRSITLTIHHAPDVVARPKSATSRRRVGRRKRRVKSTVQMRAMRASTKFARTESDHERPRQQPPSMDAMKKTSMKSLPVHRVGPLDVQHHSVGPLRRNTSSMEMRTSRPPNTPPEYCNKLKYMAGTMRSKSCIKRLYTAEATV